MLMQKLRKNIRYVLVVALVGFLGLIFFQWGANITGRKDERKTDVAKIDGVQISFGDYMGFVRTKEAENKGISREQIWAMLLEEIMWNKLIKEERIRVTDQEILAIIRSNPPREIYESEYMKNEKGEFDYNRYVELLRAPQSRAWLLEYEYKLRKEVPKEKLRSLLVSFGWTSFFEDSLALFLQMTKYDISYLQLPMFRARSLLDINDDEAAQYYASYIEDFTEPEQRVLKFVFFERKPAHYDTVEARELIEDFIIRIEEGEDFLDVAKEISDDTLVVIIFKGPVGLKPYLMNVYKDLKNGEMSGIINAPHGFEIIKRISNGKIHKVKTSIKISQTTIGEIFDKILAFKETAREIGFDSTAVEFDLTIHNTYPLDPNDVNFPVRNIDRFGEFVAKAKSDEIGGPFSSLGGYYLLVLDSIIPEYRPTFEDIASRVKGAMEKERLKIITRDYLNDIYGQLTTGKSMEEIASEDTLLYFREQQDINLAQVTMSMGGEFAGLVATLEPGQLSSPLTMEWAGYIIRCDKKMDIPFDSTMVMSIQMNKQSRLQSLTVNLFTPKEIEDNRDDFFID